MATSKAAAKSAGKSKPALKAVKGAKGTIKLKSNAKAKGGKK